MASRGRGRRGRPRAANQAPPMFDQRDFVEAKGLQLLPLHRLVQLLAWEVRVTSRFKAHHPPKCSGGRDPMVANHGFRQVENVLEAMDITSDAAKIRLVAFQLEGESQLWWDWIKTLRDLEAMIGQSSMSSSWASTFRPLLDIQRPRSS